MGKERNCYDKIIKWCFLYMMLLVSVISLHFQGPWNLLELTCFESYYSYYTTRDQWGKMVICVFRELSLSLHILLLPSPWPQEVYWILSMAVAYSLCIKQNVLKPFLNPEAEKKLKGKAWFINCLGSSDWGCVEFFLRISNCQEQLE